MQMAFRILVYIFWLFPLFASLVFWLFFLRCWIMLGHPPVPSLNDPKYIGESSWYTVTAFCLAFALNSILLLVPAGLIQLFYERIPFFEKGIKAWIIGFVLLILSLLTEAGEWFAD